MYQYSINQYYDSNNRGNRDRSGDRTPSRSDSVMGSKYNHDIGNTISSRSVHLLYPAYRGLRRSDCNGNYHSYCCQHCGSAILQPDALYQHSINQYYHRYNGGNRDRSSDRTTSRGDSDMGSKYDHDIGNTDSGRYV